MSSFETDLSGPGKNTKFEYMYRNEANYKEFRTVVLAGRLAAAELAKIENSLNDGEQFIPSQVGLRDLQADLNAKDQSETWTAEDHVWHTIDKISYTDDKAGPLSAAAMMKSWPASDDKWDLANILARLEAGMPGVYRTF